MEPDNKNTETEGLFINAKQKFSELETEYANFTELKNKLKEKVEKIDTLVSSSETKSQEVLTLLTSVNTTKQDIDSSHSRINTLKSEIENFYTTFTTLKTQIEDPTNGLQAGIDWSQLKKDEISKQYEEIIKIQTNAENLKTEIEEYKKTVEKYKLESEEFKKSIAETLNFVTSSSLTSSFIERRETVKKSTNFWLWTTIIGTALLGGAVLYIYYLQVNNQDSQNWHAWYRYLFTSPLIYLVYLSSKNYKLERDLQEKYAFKAVLSTSLESYIKLLKDKFPEDKDQLLSLTLDTIGKIYKEPYIENKQKTKIYFGFKNIINGGIELDNKIEKEVKEQIAEERE